MYLDWLYRDWQWLLTMGCIALATLYLLWQLRRWWTRPSGCGDCGGCGSSTPANLGNVTPLYSLGQKKPEQKS